MGGEDAVETYHRDVHVVLTALITTMDMDMDILVVYLSGFAFGFVPYEFCPYSLSFDNIVFTSNCSSENVSCAGVPS